MQLRLRHRSATNKTPGRMRKTAAAAAPCPVVSGEYDAPAFKLKLKRTPLHDLPPKHKYLKVCNRLAAIAEDGAFAHFMMVVIVLAGATVGAQTYAQYDVGARCVAEASASAAAWGNHSVGCPVSIARMPGKVCAAECCASAGEGRCETAMLLDTLDAWILAAFTFEIVVKLVGGGFKPYRYFAYPWNLFDFLIVNASFLLTDGSQVAVLRLLRLLRVLKLVKAVPQLQIILMGLGEGMKSICYILTLLMLVFYLFGVLFMAMFRDNDPLHFGSLTITLFTLFRMSTLEDWTDVMYINMFGCDEYGYDRFAGVAQTGRRNVTANVVVEQLGKRWREATDNGTRPCRLEYASGSPVAAAVLFVVFIFVAALVVLSLFIGIITTSMHDATETLAQENAERQRLQKLARRSRKGMGEQGQAALVFAGGSTADMQGRPGYKGARLLFHRLSQSISRCTETDEFKHLITVVILAAGLIVGLQTDENFYEEVGGSCTADGICTGGWLEVADKAVLYVFTAEVVLKMLAKETKPWRYFRSVWNCFDFTIVSACYLLTGQAVAVLRLLRLLRVLKLIKSLPQLQVIVNGLLKGMGSIGFISLLLFLDFYIYGIAAIIFFRENDPWHFNSLPTALLTLFRCATMEDWTDVMYIAYYGCLNYGYGAEKASLCTAETSQAFGNSALVFFVSFVIISSFVMLSLFIGVVTTSMQEAKNQMKMELEVNERLEDICDEHDIADWQVSQWRAAFNKFDVDGSATIDADELGIAMAAVGVRMTSEEVRAMMAKADESGHGDVDFAEFVQMLAERQEEETEMNRGAEGAEP